MLDGQSERGWPIPEHATDAAALALRHARELCDHYGVDLADGRCPWPELHGMTSGPCRPCLEHRTKGIAVELQTAAGYATDVAWHTWCREHGYRGATEHPDAPPRPDRTRGEPVWFSWARLGRMHRDDLAAREPAGQLTLDTTTEAAA